MTMTMNEREQAELIAAREEIDRIYAEDESGEIRLETARVAQGLPALAFKLTDVDPVAFLALLRRVKADFDRDRYANPQGRKSALNRKEVPIVETRSAKPPRPNLKVPNEVTKGGEAGLRAAAAYLDKVSEGRAKGR